MAAAERIERGYLGTLLRLTLLAPALVEAVFDGTAPDRIALPWLLEPLPEDWVGQVAACWQNAIPTGLISPSQNT